MANTGRRLDDIVPPEMIEELVEELTPPVVARPRIRRMHPTPEVLGVEINNRMDIQDEQP